MKFIDYLQKLILYFSLLLYCSSIASFSVVHFAHDIHHHQDDHIYRDNTHGHHHNAIIDKMLETIEEESEVHQPHTFIGIELFYHINRAVKKGADHIYSHPNLSISYSDHLATLC